MENRLRTLIDKITGSEEEFPLHQRIFNVLLVVLIVLQLAIVPFNFFIGLHIVATVWLLVALLLCALYYFTRFKGRYRQAFLLFALVGYASLVLNYMYNSGSFGPSIFLVLVFYLILVSAGPLKQMTIWLVLQSILIFALLYAELEWPELIPYTYTDDLSRFTDLGFSYVATLIAISGAVLLVRRAYRDKERMTAELTERINAQNKRLAIINEQKDKLLSILSHDLRGPLTSIKGYYDVLHNHCNDLTVKQKNEMELKLASMAESTLNLLENVLTWSRGQMNLNEFTNAETPVSSVLQEILPVHGKIALDKGVRIEVKVEPGMVMYCDPGVLSTVVRNLLNNAIKFTHSGGCVVISGCDTHQKSCLSIKDNGIGMSPKVLADIFKLNISPSFGTAHEKGSGLGLTLCKGLLEANGGSIEIASEINVGTEAKVYFPKAGILT